MKQHESADNSQGQLYIVPTPIGNLSDITQRALEVLQAVDLIAAEDTRHTGLLLQHFAINARLFALHDHNEQQKAETLLAKLKEGQNIALVSDAGTPLINDPGYHLVRTCREANIRVVPLPGPCAAIAALSAAGLPSDRFCYEGFLPAKSKGRRDTLKALEEEPRTLIFYESTHRLVESLEDICAVLGESRYVVLARELTKTWESIHGAPIGELVAWVKEDENRRKGEMVLIVEGFKAQEEALPAAALRTLALLQAEAGNKLTDLGDRIVISHLYIERRMVPLNLWLEQVNGQALRDAVEEYGNAIRQLAAANIFPGDMLFKNFGVTRHGRVVFYDYDEICYMTEVNFREIPPPRYPEDELASEPWYSVSPGDVFPEEFRHWLCADPRIGPLFEEMHADLLRADYWRALQMRIKNGHVEDVYAYRRKQRFSVRYGADSRPDKAFTPPSGKVRRSA